MKLWLVRHARPLVADGTCYGALDVPADEQATRAAAQSLASLLPAGARVWTSPLRRCLQLADALGYGQGQNQGSATAEPRLAEMDFGAWEGRPWTDIGEAALSAWTADFPRHRPGGGESVCLFMERVARALDDARADRHAHPAEAAHPVWITHAGVIRAVRLIASGVRRIESASQWPRDEIPFGACVCVTLPEEAGAAPVQQQRP